MIILLGLGATGAVAEGPAPPSDSQTVQQRTASELKAAFDAASLTAQHGPVDITLASHATLKLPQGYVYLQPKEAGRLMLAMGNRAGDGLLGMIFPDGAEAAHWFVVMRFDAAGYIKDDDAKDWKADELLTSLKEGTEQTNGDRRARGIPEMEVIGWVEKPNYDSASHQLVWAVSSRDKGAADSSDKGINYNTYTLGREGYISMDLVTDLALIDTYKPAARTLLAGLGFNEGKRYADFNASTDKIAAYGLGALVAGVAAKKLGLLALGAALFAKFWKLVIVGLLAGGGIFNKFRKRPKDPGNPPS